MKKPSGIVVSGSVTAPLGVAWPPWPSPCPGADVAETEATGAAVIDPWPAWGSEVSVGPRTGRMVIS